MIRLPAGRGGATVWKSARGVHRTTGPWTETVHAFLRHLEAEGFDGAPRVLGMDDEGREVLTYLEGEVLADPEWHPGEPGLWPDYAGSDDALVATARLLRRLHGAAASFHPTAPVWKQYQGPLVDGEIVCHGDVGRHNTVYRDGLPVALIDWESIRPNAPLVEFGVAAWNYVPLGRFPEPPDLPGRLALFATEYGVASRDAVGWAVQQARQRGVEAMRWWPVSAAEAASYLDVVAADLRWLDGERDRLLHRLDA